jgi:hypothetical protein
MTDRKKPGVAFWATMVVVVLLVVLVGYALSWGPACWAVELMGDPPWALEAYWWIYAPLFWVDSECPESIQNATNWYCGLVRR